MKNIFIDRVVLGGDGQTLNSHSLQHDPLQHGHTPLVADHENGRPSIVIPVAKLHVEDGHLNQRGQHSQATTTNAGTVPLGTGLVQIARQQGGTREMHHIPSLATHATDVHARGEQLLDQRHVPHHNGQMEWRKPLPIVAILQLGHAEVSWILEEVDARKVDGEMSESPLLVL